MEKRNIIEFGEPMKNQFNKWVLPVYTLYQGKESTAYLQLFRKKIFMVCGTPEGELDCACTAIIPDEVQGYEVVMRAFAIECLTRFGSNAYSDIRFSMNSNKQRGLDEYIKLLGYSR